MVAPGEIITEIIFGLYAIYGILISTRGLVRKGLNKEIKYTFI
jgi:hypothetical protein